MKYLKNINTKIRKHIKIIIAGVVVLIIILLSILYIINVNLSDKYSNLQSIIVKDRHGKTISLKLNNKDQYAEYGDNLPPRVKELLVEKEDRYYYYHLGINPFSILRATGRYIASDSPGGSSTITQQLVKNLLNNAQDRTLLNKFEELFGTFALEIFRSKKQILTMYANTVYMGNQIQGLFGASKIYFGKELSELNDSEITTLLSTLSSPTITNPWKPENITNSTLLAKRLGVDFKPSEITLSAKSESYLKNIETDTNFELSTIGNICTQTCNTTIDSDLSDKLRLILGRTINNGKDLGMTNGAIVVIKEPENQILALIGTPLVGGTDSGYSINMAIEPRPIGSTAKPFIYLKAFEKGLRPYTLVNDREYKFSIINDMPFYPKNYDGLFRGWVTLHYALSNSLNIPSVKVLEYVGLPDFYYFLEHILNFKPLQDLDGYGYGIALGGLEMDTLTLTYYLSIFPNAGTLKPLQLYLNRDSVNNYVPSPMSEPMKETKIADEKYIELVNRVLNDRKTGVEQFGLSSNLNLSQDNYAVKTGTSRDYHDSWTVGYTPDYTVAVWVGNAENTPLQHVTGSSGAGRIWNEAMQLLISSEYNKKTPFNFSNTKEVNIENNLDYGLLADDIFSHRNLLKDNNLIISPHSDDNISFELTTAIPLISNEEVDWYNESTLISHGKKAYFYPPAPGNYEIKAVSKNTTETIMLHLINR